jgi:V8-like Glu-specific endopeptidase
MVFTAGHCVNTGANQWMEDWIYVPAYYYGSTPYGIWEAAVLTSFNGWILGGDLNYDVGVVNVTNPSSPFTLVQTTGGNGLQYDSNDCYCYTPDVSPWGYPAENGFTGDVAYYCLNVPTSMLFTSYASQLMTGCDALDNGGSSGGPWFVDFDTSTLVGTEDALTSTNVPGSPGYIASPYFGSDIGTIYQNTEYQ